MQFYPEGQKTQPHRYVATLPRCWAKSKEEKRKYRRKLTALFHFRQDYLFGIISCAREFVEINKSKHKFFFLVRVSLQRNIYFYLRKSTYKVHAESTHRIASISHITNSPQYSMPVEVGLAESILCSLAL